MEGEERTSTPTRPPIHVCFFFIQGPKFVSDEEIERIKAKIEEDNRAIAALESKKYGETPEILLKAAKPQLCKI